MPPAKRHLGTGIWRVALAEFKRAFALMKHDAVRFNIAVCLERLGRNREAREEYLAAAQSQTLSASERERAKSAAEKLLGKLGILVAEGRPSGRPVRVDGTQRCVTPCRVELDPGQYQVSVGSAEVATLELRGGREAVILPATARSVPAAKQVRRDKAVPPRTEAAGPGVLFWTGGALAVVGTAGTVFFGLRTERLQDEYTAAPTRDRLDDGRQSRLLTNVALGVAVVGASMALVDLLLLDHGPATAERAARRTPRPAPHLARCSILNAGLRLAIASLWL